MTMSMTIIMTNAIINITITLTNNSYLSLENKVFFEGAPPVNG